MNNKKSEIEINADRFHGIIPPMVTPLKNETELDHEGLEKLIEYLISGGVHGIFILGTTGEGPSLSSSQQYEMIERSCQLIDKRVTVMVGISDPSFTESIKLAEHATSCKADAVVLAPPYYFPAGQPELLEYLKHLAPKLPLPLFLYNMPTMTKIDIEVETLIKAAEIDGIIGLKDSSCNMIKFHEFITAMAKKPDFTLLIGPEELMAESVLFGGHGGVCGGANICPRLYVDLYEAAQNKNIEKILELQKKVFQLRRIYACGQYASSGIKGIKCALSCLGICNDFMGEPFHAFRQPEREQVKTILKEMKLL